MNLIFTLWVAGVIVLFFAQSIKIKLVKWIVRFIGFALILWPMIVLYLNSVNG